MLQLAEKDVCGVYNASRNNIWQANRLATGTVPMDMDSDQQQIDGALLSVAQRQAQRQLQSLGGAQRGCYWSVPATSSADDVREAVLGNPVLDAEVIALLQSG
jgi:hypothetical protein